MNVFFIVDEFPFFLPRFLDTTLGELTSKHVRIVGITPLVTPKNHKTLYSYLVGELPRLGLVSVFRLAFEFGKLIMGKVAYQLRISNTPHSIEQVARKHGIRIVPATKVNDPEYLTKLRHLNIDIIVSSCSQIFKEDLLNLPAISCINRHSGLLPSYGGLFPVFQAMIHEEKYVGTTVHTMVKKIDGGKILAQKKYRVDSTDTLFHLYDVTYGLSVTVTVEAIMKLMSKRYTAITNTYAESYYSFPKREDWDVFWKKRKKII